MKKILSTVFILLSATLLFASGSSIDGRIAVASKGELPSGLFAKTAGYLPGDSVTITNPANGSVLQVLNLGTIDQAEGVAILLSGESAERLGIKKGTELQVKLAPRSGSFDESVSGSAILSLRTFEEEKVPEEESAQTAAIETAVKEETDSVKEAAAEESTPVVEEAVAAEENVPAEETESVEETAVAEPIPEDIDAVQIEPEEETEENIAPEETVVPEQSEYEYEEYIETDGDFIEEKNNVEMASPAERAEMQNEDSSAEKPVPAEESTPVEEEAISVEESAPVEEEPQTVVPEEPFEAESVEDAVIEMSEEEKKSVLKGDMKGEEVASVEPDETPAEDECEVTFDVEEEAVAEEPFEAEPVEDAVIEMPKEEKESVLEGDMEGEEVASVEPDETPEEAEGEVAFDAEEEAVAEELFEAEPIEDAITEDIEEQSTEVSEEPEVTEVPEESAEDAVIAEDETEAYEPIILVPAEPEAPVPETAENAMSVVEKEEPIVLEPVEVQEKKEEVSEVKANDNENILESESELAKGYYIQFATFGDIKNVYAAKERYSKFPLCVVKTAKGLYKVLAGPLTVDEYGAVLAKFRDFGFKDAFVRKIK
ncbi:SPOR domain-containing protein [Treponema peruense]|uniref:SPOR domain-containing protein n=1 Tax=Treponema peruense TaxID=2787628 RepID=A0A7T3RBQ9_9SPIR|nr:SPOR domain-containing protein [Treponema peruense]QQA00157.1 SPOR domain-containing protein [Treponema peruense]